MTTTAQEIANVEVQIDILRKSLSQLEWKLGHVNLSDKEIKRYNSIMMEEQKKLDTYKKNNPDLFI